MMTATKVKDMEGRSNTKHVDFGAAAIYRLSEPYEGHEYLYVSTSRIMGRSETYAFACTEDGDVSDWTELECSMRGDVTHAMVLADAGYTIIDP